jgi:hypothetical protein
LRQNIEKHGKLFRAKQDMSLAREPLKAAKVLIIHLPLHAPSRSQLPRDTCFKTSILVLWRSSSYSHILFHHVR